MLKAIVAHDPNRVIGNNLDIPWHIREDFLHFKETTTNHMVVYGSKTFESMGKPLPNRVNIILNFDKNFDAMGCEVVTSIDEIVRRYKDSEETVFICGGASIYRQFLPYCEELIISEVKKEYEGNIYFPEYENDFETYEEVEYDEFVVKYMRRK